MPNRKRPNCHQTAVRSLGGWPLLLILPPWFEIWWIIKQAVCSAVEYYLQSTAHLLKAHWKLTELSQLDWLSPSMSCDLSMVIAYYDDKWTHLSNWSLNTHFSSFPESWGHYFATLDRQERQQQERMACMNRHGWLFYPTAYIYSYFWWSIIFFPFLMGLPEHSLFSLDR